MNCKFISFGFCLIFGGSFSLLYSQPIYIPANNVPVYVNGSTIRNPWVGGFNAPIFSEIDLNGDGIKDLFVFDKEGDRITTYLNDGTPDEVDYHFAPEYKSKFPHGMVNWVLLKDFDMDGHEDIFTYSFAGGIKVYKNNYTSQTGLSFSLAYTIVNSIYSTFTTNLYVSPVNLPAIVDIDFDGDLDIITLGIVMNAFELHKNEAMELFGNPDTLVYKLKTPCWGNFGLSSMNNSAILNISCRESNNHSGNSEESISLDGGSCMIAIDLDGDIDYDLLHGDLLSETMLYLENGGDSSYANMISQDATFPTYNVPVNLPIMPSPYYFDVDNDGFKDFITAPCISGPAENFNNVWYYKNTTDNVTNVFNYEKNRFLVDEMIEVGSGANVVFYDVDDDGLNDMVIGNNGYYSSVFPFVSGLAYYRNSGTAVNPAFDFVTSDFAGLFQLSLNGLAPAFGDIDSDGDHDLFVGNNDGTVLYYTNTAGPGNFPFYVLTQVGLVNNSGGVIDVGQLSKPQLVDVNRDGKLDLLIGEKSGNINYYENTGSASVPEFTLINSNFGGVQVSSNFSIYGYSYPCLWDNAGTYQLLVGSASGYIYRFDNIDNNLNGNFTLVDSMYLNIHEPAILTLAVADIDGDNVIEILTGNNAGGVTLYKHDGFTNVMEQLLPENNFIIYPNPAIDELIIKFDTANPRYIALVDITGRMIEEKYGNSNVVLFDVKQLNGGIYICKVIEGEKVSTKKFIVK